MGTFIVALASLVILIPLIFFLPLGLSLQGKIIIILTSFILANVGILASTTYPFWLTGVFLVVLVILITFLMNTRLKTFLYEAPSNSENGMKQDEDHSAVFSNSADHPGEKKKKLLNRIASNHFEKMSQKEEINPNGEEAVMHASTQNMEEILEPFEKVNTADHDTSEDTVESKQVLEEETADIDLLEQIRTDNETKEDTIKPKEIEEPQDLGVIKGGVEEELLEEDLSFLLDRDTFADEFNGNWEGSEEENIDSISKIEDVLNDHTDEQWEEGKEDGLLVGEFADGGLSENSLDETKEPSNSIEENDFANNQQWNVNDEMNAGVDVDTEGNYEIIHDKNEGLIDEKEDYEDKDAVAFTDEHLESYEIERNVITKDHLENQFLSESHIASSIETENKVERQEESLLQRQLIQTMVSQLYIAKKSMSEEEFEQLVVAHLQPSLSDQNYYTFASILLEHYIQTREANKLENLLTHLGKKFKNYPILVSEIQFLYEHYCEKQL